MARAQPLHPDERRATLLAAARRVFAHQGYHAAGVSDIIEDAGVARGTFYNYFESKRQIFGAVLDALMEEVAGAVEPIDVTRPIPPQVRENVARIVSRLQEQGEGARILFTDAAGVDAEGREALAEFYGVAAGRIERALRTGQVMGVVRACDVRIVALCLLGMLKEPVFQGLLRDDPVAAEALVDEIFGLVTAGVVRL
ncbi:MAG: TetR/AcrR family transcriptional regulator [Myxococcota bacterium]